MREDCVRLLVVNLEVPAGLMVGITRTLVRGIGRLFIRSVPS